MYTYMVTRGLSNPAIVQLRWGKKLTGFSPVCSFTTRSKPYQSRSQVPLVCCSLFDTSVSCFDAQDMYACSRDHTDRQYLQPAVVPPGHRPSALVPLWEVTGPLSPKNLSCSCPRIKRIQATKRERYLKENSTLTLSSYSTSSKPLSLEVR